MHIPVVKSKLQILTILKGESSARAWVIGDHLRILLTTVMFYVYAVCVGVCLHVEIILQVAKNRWQLRTSLPSYLGLFSLKFLQGLLLPLLDVSSAVLS